MCFEMPEILGIRCICILGVPAPESPSLGSLISIGSSGIDSISELEYRELPAKLLLALIFLCRARLLSLRFVRRETCSRVAALTYNESFKDD